MSDIKPPPYPAKPPDPEPVAESTEATIARINELSKAARTSWFGLLAYLAFVGVTLLGVEDADFFIPSRQTQLPLINVSIPTASFFLFAPILGAALYVYLHLYLTKLWRALGPARTQFGGASLAPRIFPWLINDMAMSYKGDSAAPKKPLTWLSDWTTWLLAWIAGPLVLLGFWWRSHPAHNEWLTLMIAACVAIAIYTGWSSWWTFRSQLEGSEQRHWRGPKVRWLKWAGALALILVSWLRTEGGVDFYVNAGIDLRERLSHGERGALERYLGVNLIGEGKARAICRENDPEPCDQWKVENIETPQVVQEFMVAQRWPTLDTFRFPNRLETDETDESWQITKWFLKTWNGLSGQSILASSTMAGVAFVEIPDDWRNKNTHRRRFRAEFCKREGLVPDQCGHVSSKGNPLSEHVATARKLWCESAFGKEDCTEHFNALNKRFEEEWEEERNSLASRLGGSIDLSGRDLRDADLSRAFLPGANLRQARLEGANLRQARLEGADLTLARLEGADLWLANFQSASWAGATIGPSPAHDADFRDAKLLSQAQLDLVIGNSKTLLPDGLDKDTKAPFYVWSCWETAPEGFDAMVKRIAARRFLIETEESLRKQFLCGDAPRVKTGTPAPLDTP